MAEIEMLLRDQLGLSGDGLGLSDFFLFIGPVLLAFGAALAFIGYALYGAIIFSLGLFFLVLILSGKAIIYLLAYFD